MGAIARADVVALKMACDVAEGIGIAVDVEGADIVPVFEIC